MFVVSYRIRYVVCANSANYNCGNYNESLAIREDAIRYHFDDLDPQLYRYTTVQQHFTSNQKTSYLGAYMFSK